MKKKKKKKECVSDCYLVVYLNIPYFQTLLIISFGILGRVCAQFLFLNLTYFNDNTEDVSSYLAKSRWVSI